MFEGEFVDSRVDGVFKWYYDSGEIMYEWDYKMVLKMGHKNIFIRWSIKIKI